MANLILGAVETAVSLYILAIFVRLLLSWALILVARIVAAL